MIQPATRELSQVAVHWDGQQMAMPLDVACVTLFVSAAYHTHGFSLQ